MIGWAQKFRVYVFTVASNSKMVNSANFLVFTGINLKRLNINKINFYEDVDFNTQFTVCCSHKHIFPKL